MNSIKNHSKIEEVKSAAKKLLGGKIEIALPIANKDLVRNKAFIDKNNHTLISEMEKDSEGRSHLKCMLHDEYRAFIQHLSNTNMKTVTNRAGKKVQVRITQSEAVELCIQHLMNNPPR